jgi:hypothetical protein
VLEIAEVTAARAVAIAAQRVAHAAPAAADTTAAAGPAARPIAARKAGVYTTRAAPERTPAAAARPAAA